MLLATLCMALYTLWSRPFIARSAPLPFLTAGMGAGAACLVLLAWSQGGFATAAAFGWPQWLAILYLGLSGAAANFYLWVFALERTTPTRVANTITVNPVTAGILAEILLNEPIGLNLMVGIVAVGTGIWIASTNRRSTR
jgi:drug/metabolite transporter (DMT)-like permease